MNRAWLCWLSVLPMCAGGLLSLAGENTGQRPPYDDAVGTTYAPMDSWIYPALERLGALGFVPSQTLAIRPWTRLECLRQVRQARGLVDGTDDASGRVAEAEQLLPELEQELQQPYAREEAGVESVYQRFGSIAGPALSDGLHFGQTWSNDYGRPLGRGSSGITGVAVRARRGRFFLYDRQELQSDPGKPGRTAAQGEVLQSLDLIPIGPQPSTNPFPAMPSVAASLRQRPLELYTGVAFAGYAVSFGKQELYWGPTVIGPLAFSTNAEPTYNLRLSATRPHPFPLLPKVGSYRVDFVFGKLSGHQFPQRPYFNGQKVDLSFGRLLELSFTRWSVLWGVGHPMTLRSLFSNFTSTSSTGTDFGYGDRADPGDRKSGFDFRLHLPRLGHAVTLYADSYADDELSPLAAPRRVMWSPGIYFARFPGLPHVDLRLEMATSEELSQDEGGLRFLINTQYRDSNTNKGFLLGNAVGRDARVFEGRLGYWKSARSRVEVGYRQSKGGTVFLPGGSTTSDAFLRAEHALGNEWSVKVFAQRERFLIPIYMSAAHTNASGWLQVTWSPRVPAWH